MIYAGIELGGTKCAAILAGNPDNILERAVIPTSSVDETLGAIERLLRDWKRDQGFDALGLASFGPVDVDPRSPSYGHMLATPKAGWAGADIVRRLRDAADVPVAFDTDVNGSALAEMRWGTGRGFDDFAYVTVGTGVGVGLIVNGRPTRGFGHCELGHIRVARLPGDDWPGSCPYHRDCVEGLASGSSLQARFGGRLSELEPDHPVWESVAWTLGQLCHAIVCAAAPRRIASVSRTFLAESSRSSSRAFTAMCNFRKTAITSVRRSSAAMSGRLAQSRSPCRLGHSSDQHSGVAALQPFVRRKQQTIAGPGGIAPRLDRAFERNHPASAVLQSVGVGVNQLEHRAVDQCTPFIGGKMLRERFSIRRATGHGHGIVEVKLTRPAVIVEPVGDVGVLLELDQRQTAPDRVDRARRNEEEIPRTDGAPIEKVFDRPVKRGAAQFPGRNVALQPKA
jgi:fructokinase